MARPTSCPSQTSSRKSYHAAHLYVIFGVVSGLYHREFTKLHGFGGRTQLALVHTHLLALGMLAFLVVLALDKLFEPSGAGLFTAFFWVYNAGVVLSVAMMFVHGSQTLLGRPVPVEVSLAAGLGHILLTAGLVLLFVLIGRRLKELAPARGPKAAAPVPDHDARVLR
ncbi:DUF2871 domain-containing protein [Streptomyces sp. NBC_00212]|uniref:DUF2871 domain-containing protein n=1 Tax=Streptomyces sp. NBC_00212 TaxID=2975684 RepID=UPI00324DCB39